MAKFDEVPFLHDGQSTYFSKLKKKTLVHSFIELPLMQQLYGNILADAPCVFGVIHGPVVAGFLLGESLGAKMAIIDVQIMAVINSEI